MRVGLGYDVHKLVEGRDLVLGGLKFDYHLGFWAILMQMCSPMPSWMPSLEP